jgi:hypothetical protein
MNKNAHETDRGQVLIIFVFVIIGLIALSGLAVDGGNAYANRRGAQNAADAAALAGSVARVNWEKQNGALCNNFNTADPLLPSCSSSLITSILNNAANNGYDNNPAHKNRVDVYSPPIDGPYHDCSAPCDPHDYIQVVIHEDVDTFFAKVVGIQQTHSTVEAVTLAKYVPAQDLYGGSSLVELDNSGCGAFLLNGDYSVTLNGGGIFVNSNNSSCAFQQKTCKTLKLNGNASIKGVGKGQFACSPPPTMTSGAGPYLFPPAPLLTSEPAECSGPALPTKKSGNYSPGHYDNIPPGKLDAGVYCVDDAKMTNKDTADGTAGVFIYVKPTGSISINGGNLMLVAPTSGTYAGYALYFYGSSRQNCTINGGSKQTFTGLVFLPNCDLKVNGNSAPTGMTTQIVAATFDMTGTVNAIFNGPAGKIPQTPELNQVGLFH